MAYSTQYVTLEALIPECVCCSLSQMLGGRNGKENETKRVKQRTRRIQRIQVRIEIYRSAEFPRTDTVPSLPCKSSSLSSSPCHP
jgi:hypothetical protein